MKGTASPFGDMLRKNRRRVNGIMRLIICEGVRIAVENTGEIPKAEPFLIAHTRSPVMGRLVEMLIFVYFLRA